MQLPFFVFVLLSFEVAVYLSMDMYLPSLPFLAIDFGVINDYSQYTVIAWFLGAISMQLITGPITDAVGRRPCMIAGAALFFISTTLCALTDNFYLFLCARFLQGATVAIPLVVGYAAIHESFEDKVAMKTLIIMGSIAILAPTLGPLIGSAIVHFAHWRLTFAILAIWGAISLIALLFKFPESIQSRHPIEYKRVLCDYRSILSNPRFLMYAIPLSLDMFGFMAWLVESPFIIIDGLGHSVLIFGTVQFFVFSSYIIGARIANRIIDTYSPNDLLKFGYTMGMIGAILGLLVAYLDWYVIYSATFCMMICGFGTAFCFGPSNRMAISQCSEPMGSRTALFTVVMNLFGALGMLLMGYINNNTMFNLFIIVAIGLCSAFVISMLSLSRLGNPQD